VPPTERDLQVGADVPLVLGLSFSNQMVLFPAIVPGLSQVYDASVAATVTSTAGNATLSVFDSSQNPNGRLTNGSFALTSPLQVRATNQANPNSSFVPLLATPTSLLSYNTWISNDPVTVTVRQAIGANEALLAGSYSKLVTFTLSTNTP
jgi:hypothetical protein